MTVVFELGTSVTLAGKDHQFSAWRRYTHSPVAIHDATGPKLRLLD